jgi:hypothetical protein
VRLGTLMLTEKALQHGTHIHITRGGAWDCSQLYDTALPPRQY